MFDTIGLCQLAHGYDVLIYMVNGNVALIHCYVVGTCQYDNILGMQIDDIGTESCQHLGSNLSADTAAHIALVVLEELGIEPAPVPCDGVAHEHHLHVLVCSVFLLKDSVLCPILRGSETWQFQSDINRVMV